MLAIEALLTTASVAEAAERSGIPKRTLFRMLTDADFRALYRDVSRQRLAETAGRVRAVACEALGTLRAALTEERAADRIRAAIALLDIAVKVDLDDLAQRVAALEAASRHEGEP